MFKRPSLPEVSDFNSIYKNQEELIVQTCKQQLQEVSDQ